jgi:hypothetical protein
VIVSSVHQDLSILEQMSLVDLSLVGGAHLM